METIVLVIFLIAILTGLPALIKIMIKVGGGELVSYKVYITFSICLIVFIVILTQYRDIFMEK